MRSAEEFTLAASQILRDNGQWAAGALVVQGAHIADLLSGPCPADTIHLPAGCRIIPGLIDLHIHGREGCDVMDASQTSLNTISRSLARHGVTAFLGTTVTSSFDETLAALAAVAQARAQGLEGAEILGSYSEGLFFTGRFKGAHNADYFLPPTREILQQMIDAGRGSLRCVALAPELDGACDIIGWLSQQGIRCLLGHTDASYEQTARAMAAGAVAGVHVFNGMRGIHHRDPGCAGAVLMHPDCCVELIADGVHVHPVIMRMVLALKGREKTALISDCINAGGLPDGQYRLGKLDVLVKDGVSRTLSGSLAGSTLTLDLALQNMVTLTGTALADAVYMASQVPANLLGLGDQLGSLTVGKIASFAVLDAHGHVRASVVRGRCVFVDPSLRSVLSALRDPCLTES